jgi:hypothetical protein
VLWGRVREVDRACPACGGEVKILDPCRECSGTGVAERRCRACHTWNPVGDYLVGGIAGRRCSACRSRVRSRLRTAPAGIAQDGLLLVKFARESHNRKTGAIPVAMTPASTCPPACPWKGAGCYAEQHFTAIHWRRLSAGDGITWDAFCAEVAALPPGQLWRMGEAGDLPGRGDYLDGDLLDQLVEANRGRRGFGYTHKPVLGAGSREVANRQSVAVAVRGGLCVNLSADSLDHADRLADLGVAPVTVVLPSSQSRACRTPGGRKVVVCPAIGREGVTCETCELCAVSGRKSVVGFPAHGDSRAKMTREIVQLKLF